MKRCKFDKSLHCGYVSCLNCPVRKKLGQRLLVEEPAESVKSTVVMKSQEVTCPFCLYTDYISKFYIRLKHGKVSDKRFQCPDCTQIMQKDTLVKELSVEEYAEWMLMMNPWRKRVDFPKFKSRLKEMGISYQFWDAYNKAKQELGEAETYEDYVMRKQEEEHKKDLSAEKSV